MGYMFIEIAFIQKLILTLDHPSYSLSIVISSLLLASGLGSYFSHLIQPGGRGHILVLTTIAVLSPLYAGSSSWIQMLLVLPFNLRIITTLMIIAPIGLLMGMPFPLGVKMLTKANEKLVPLVWVGNGCASVIGSILSIIIALFFGFSKIFLIAGIIYLSSLLIFYNRNKIT
jgi:hypothetical protein